MKRLSYEELLRRSEKTNLLVLKDVSDVFRSIAYDPNSSYDLGSYEDDTTSRDRLSNLVNLVNNTAYTVYGDDSDYHNLAVDYARIHMPKEALEILFKGLESVPFSPTLWSDVLLYATESAQWDICKEADRKLSEIERSSWGWRAYSFTIDYYLSEIKRLPKGEERNLLKGKIKRLVKEFIAYSEEFPEEAADKAYNRKAAVMKELGGTETQIQILEQGCQAAKSAPQCALRLADIFYDRAEYEKSLKYIEMCIPAASKPQPDVNPEYVYLLRGLVNKSLLMSSAKNGSFEDFKDEIERIYRDFSTVRELTGPSSPFKISAEENIKVLDIQLKDKQYKKTETDEY